MPVPDTSDIDAAIVAVLGADPTLKGLLPDGVFFDEAPPGSKRFVLIDLLVGHDEPQYGRCAYEEKRYQVQAVGLSTVLTGPQAKTAAARIHELLEDRPLTVPGYSFMACYREEPIRELEVDDVDPSIRWYHRGGQYVVTATAL